MPKTIMTEDSRRALNQRIHDLQQELQPLRERLRGLANENASLTSRLARCESARRLYSEAMQPLLALLAEIMVSSRTQ